jgi:hypothetical protein
MPGDVKGAYRIMLICCDEMTLLESYLCAKVNFQWDRELLKGSWNCSPYKEWRRVSK